MVLNGSKCHLLVGGNKNDTFSCTIDGSIIKETAIENLLGIKLDRELKFDIHGKEICKKAGQISMHSPDNVKYFLLTEENF